MDKVASVARNNRLEGRPTPVLESWDVIQARSQLKKGGVPGSDGITPHVYHMLPLLSVLHMSRLFRDYGR